MSKQRPIEELNATLTLDPPFGAGSAAGGDPRSVASGESSAEHTTLLPETAIDTASWHRGTTVEGDHVLAFVVRGDFALDVADAARRALLVSASALVPIREVGEFFEADGSPVTVVVYEDPQAPALRELTSDAALRPETARSIAGQVAEALELARRKGVRHRHLDESHVYVDVEGDRVSIIGAGVVAAAMDDEPSNADAQAVNPDVRSIGRILFVALAGREPEFFGGADVVDPSIASPRTVPDDLALITRTLLTHEGSLPENPPYRIRDAVSDLSPWQSIPVTLEAFDPDQHAGAPTPLSAEALAKMRGEVPPRRGRRTQEEIADAPTLTHGITPISEPISTEHPQAAGPTTPAVSGVTDSANAADATDTTAASETAPSDPSESQDQDSSSPGADPAETHPAQSPETAGPTSKHGPQEAAWGDMIAAGTTGGAAATASAASNSGADPSSEPKGPIRVAGRTSSLAEAKAAAEPDFATKASPASSTSEGEESSAETAHKRPPLVPPSATPKPAHTATSGTVIPVRGRSATQGEPLDGEGNSLFRDVARVALGNDEAVVSPATGEGAGTHSKVIIIAAILALILAVVFALTSLTSVGRDRGVTSNPTTAAPSPTATGDAEGTADDAPAEEQPAAAAPAIAEVQAVYPDNADQIDNPDEAGLANDGNPETAWTTQRYATPEFGNLRTGMGLQLNLGDGGPVKEVGVTPGVQDGGHIEVRPMNDGHMGEPIGGADLKPGEETVITLDEPTEAKELVLWAPTIGAVDGGFRLEIAEVRVG